MKLCKNVQKSEDILWRDVDIKNLYATGKILSTIGPNCHSICGTIHISCFIITLPQNRWYTLFFYKNNFIRTRASYLTKSQEQAKNNPRLTFSKN